jgi:vitamin B12/bleomycin/antimicrobial peptide transport system ATP-binding/permease protein
MKRGLADYRSSKKHSVLAKVVVPLTAGRLVPEMLTLFRAL